MQATAPESHRGCFQGNEDSEQGQQTAEQHVGKGLDRARPPAQAGQARGPQGRPLPQEAPKCETGKALPGGLEPPTLRLTAARSNQLS